MTDHKTGTRDAWLAAIASRKGSLCMSRRGVR